MDLQYVCILNDIRDEARISTFSQQIGPALCTCKFRRPTAVWPVVFVMLCPTYLWSEPFSYLGKHILTFCNPNKIGNLFYWGINSFDHNWKVLSDIILIRRYDVTLRPATMDVRLMRLCQKNNQKKRLAWLAILIFDMNALNVERSSHPRVICLSQKVKAPINKS